MGEGGLRDLIVCLLGPTASGKTELAVELAQRFALEIVSVDSAMVYRRMNIGTAKPGADILSCAPHHLIDIREPWENYSAGEFCRDAEDVVADIRQRGNIPLLVGGTFLYFRAFTDGLSPLPQRDAEYRAHLERQADEIGWSGLHAQLAAIDPSAAERIKPQDRQRIQRAMEVAHLTGRPMSAFHADAAGPERPGVVRITLEPDDRSALHKVIEKRFDRMLAAGFVDEVRSLHSEPRIGAYAPSMRAVGYRQLWAHLDGQTTLDEARRQAIVATRRYAKRQFTWLRGLEPDLRLNRRGVGSAPDMIQALRNRGLEPA